MPGWGLGNPIYKDTFVSTSFYRIGNKVDYLWATNPVTTRPTKLQLNGVVSTNEVWSILQKTYLFIIMINE